MKKIFGSVLIVLLIAGTNLHAKDVTTVKAKDTEISDNLDLKAVASVFGDSKDLEEFEKKLNDPKTQISNLDLNEDGEVDYLRVVETSKDKTHLVTIQSVIKKDQYQDVATIDVEKESKAKTQVQVVGDVYMYGPGYIVEPVYVRSPVICMWFWGPFYSPWRSPFYWGHYPPYYRPWHPYRRNIYRRNVNVHINVNNSYRHTSVRKSKTSIELQKKIRRNDFGTKHPNKSFAKRNKGVKNRQQLNQKREIRTSGKLNSKPEINKSKVGNTSLQRPAVQRPSVQKPAAVQRPSVQKPAAVQRPAGQRPS
ncbi:MAG: hypothetical protein JJW03_04005, partial [Desulfosarcina sp.]|nr:hypothetical protein [Desulfobacterales bacterium]